MPTHAVIRPRNASFSEFSGPARVVHGWGTIAELKRFVDSLGAAVVAFIVDKHVLPDPQLRSTMQTLESSDGLIVHEHDGAEPSLEQVRAVAAHLPSHVDGVIAVGGGSTIDTAKAVALQKVTTKDLDQFEGANQVDVAPLPLIAIPTTAGTGSEVSGSCVLTDEKSKRKISIRSPKLVPKIAILDPRFLASVPKGVIRATGVDAFGHALEAYFSNAGNVLTDGLALRAMALLMKSLPTYYANPMDRSAAEDMAWGSCIAGIAFNSARVGLAHAVASAIGPLTHLSHGICVGLGLPHALRINLKSRSDDRVSLLFHLGIDDAGDDWEGAVSRKLTQLYEAVDFPATAKEAGRQFEVDEALAMRIIKSGRLETNPVKLGPDALREILISIRG